MHKICMTEDVPEREARSFETSEGNAIFVTQRDGVFYAYQNLCPHLQVELEFLENQLPLRVCGSQNFCKQLLEYSTCA